MRQKVLVVLHSDGTVEAYADKEHVDVKIVTMPHAPGGETLAEEYLELTLPRNYRELYWPGCRRASDRVRTFRPSDIFNRECRLEFLKVLDDLAVDADKSHEEHGYSYEMDFDA